MRTQNNIDLTEFCSTDLQKEIVRLYNDGNGMREVDRLLGKAYGTCSSVLHRLKIKAAKQNVNDTHGKDRRVGEGYFAKRVSTAYKADGTISYQWVIEERDLEASRLLMEEYTQHFVKSFTPIQEIPAPKEIDSEDIIPWFNIGDAHIGMLAHEAEVGENFDLKIAKRELISAMHTLIARAPTCERCVIQDMGDFTHYETFAGTTEASGHALDFDTRYSKMIEVAAEIMQSIITIALQKFKYVDVIINQGNHSRSNDIWMRVFLQWIFKDNERLHVLDNKSVFIPYRMGNTLVMCHHSDKCNPTKLAHVMSTDFRQDWGETLYRYVDIGHIHHKMQSKEHPGVIIESFNQLAASDKYAHDGGWRSRSFLTCVLRSKTYGEKGREVLTAEEVKDNINQLAPGTSAKARREVYSV